MRVIFKKINIIDVYYVLDLKIYINKILIKML